MVKIIFPASTQVQFATAERRPKILVSFAHDGPGHEPWLSDGLARLAENASDELRRQGAEVFVVNSSDEGAATHLAFDFDGVVVLGGGDVDPALYGAPSEGLYGVSRVADDFETYLVRTAIENEVPLFGICRGMQLINVALGGSLVEDLGSDSIHQVHGPVPQMRDHSVLVDGKSQLAAALEAASVNVRSGHHQAVDRLGEGLKVVATAPDGVVEAIEHDTSWVLGVQWHPEEPGTEAGQLRALFKYFLEQRQK